MDMRTIKMLFVVLALATAVTAWTNADGFPVPEVRDGKAGQADYARLSEELKRLEAGLPAKREDLARLRRKWVAVKGRMPTAKEVKEFEKKRAKGEADFEDNPYVNKNPLSSPGIYREAYYKKLNEIRSDEARIAKLKEEIAGLNR